MRRFRLLAVCSFALCILAAGSAGAATVVENYIATGTLSAQMPGAPSGPGVDFSYSFQFVSIDFAPGAVVFMGQPVDFDGTEASWLGSVESGQIDFDTASGPAIANVQIAGTRTGAVEITNVVGGATGVELGANFSASMLDGTLSTFYDVAHVLDPLVSPGGLIPPATLLSHSARHQITGIDVLNGIAQVNVTGDFSLDEGPVAVAEESWGKIKERWRNED